MVFYIPHNAFIVIFFTFEFAENFFIGFVKNISQYIQSTPVGHSDDKFFDTQL